MSGFFKTGKGQYGEGDVFFGLTVPQQRIVAKKYKNLLLADIQTLLKSKIHEHRLIALIILAELYKKADEKIKKEIAKFYLRNTKFINNWDLVDLSAEKILGEHFMDRDKKIIYKLVKSKNIWERRIAVLTTFQFLKNHKFDDTLKVAELLLNDTHDLIHKATGWMLREVGKRDRATEEKFLLKHYKKMPRTMLRYAIEHFDEKKRKFYLKKEAA